MKKKKDRLATKNNKKNKLSFNTENLLKRFSNIPLVLTAFIAILLIISYVVVFASTTNHNKNSAKTYEAVVNVAFDQTDYILSQANDILTGYGLIFSAWAENNSNNEDFFKLVSSISKIRTNAAFVKDIVFFTTYDNRLITTSGTVYKNEYFDYEKNSKFWNHIMAQYNTPTMIAIEKGTILREDMKESENMFVIPKVFPSYKIGFLIFVDGTDFLKYCGADENSNFTLTIYSNTGQKIISNHASANSTIDLKHLEHKEKTEKIGLFGNYIYEKQLGYAGEILSLKRKSSINGILIVLAALIIGSVIMLFLLLKRRQQAPNPAQKALLCAYMLDSTIYEHSKEDFEAMAKDSDLFTLCAILCYNSALDSKKLSEITEHSLEASDALLFCDRNALFLLIKVSHEAFSPQEVQKRLAKVTKACRNFSEPHVVVGRTFSNIVELNKAYREILVQITMESFDTDSNIADIMYDLNIVRDKIISCIAKNDFKELHSTVRSNLEEISKQLPYRAMPYYIQSIYFSIAEILDDRDNFVKSTYKILLGGIDRYRMVFNAELLTNALINIVTEAKNFHNTSESPTQIADVLDYMNKNYRNPLYLDTIAEHFSMTPKSFSIYFKRKTGTTFINQLAKIRINEAKKLLLESDMQINEISEAVGYNSTTTFAAAFKKETGMTPAKFKK